MVFSVAVTEMSFFVTEFLSAPVPRTEIFFRARKFNLAAFRGWKKWRAVRRYARENDTHTIIIFALFSIIVTRTAARDYIVSRKYAMIQSREVTN